MKFLCDNCKAKYQIADDKVAGKTVRMKCRKCGHQIEVRAAVTETSVSTSPPKPDAPQRPAPPRQSTLATSLSSAKPRQQSQPGSALAGAFQRNVQQEPASHVGSAPTTSDRVELSVTDEWYVAINGVPVGPVRISELRRKAATGAVTEDSLCWQEGLEEWRPVRSVPELAAIVREAGQGNRPSLLAPPPEPTPPPQRASSPPKPPPARPAPPRATAPPPSDSPFSVSPAPPRPPVPAPPRSNVVPLRPAAQLDDVSSAPMLGGAAPNLAPTIQPLPTPPPPAPVLTPAPLPPPTPAPLAAASDPFAIPVVPSAPLAPPPAASLAPPPSIGYAPPAKKGGVPVWFWLIAVFVLGFGGAAALFFLTRQPPQQIVVQVPVPTTPTGTTPSGDIPPPTAATETATPTTSATTGAKVATGPKTGGGSAPAEKKGGAADLSGLLGGNGSPNAGGPTGGGPSAGGGTMDQAAVERVVASHRAGVKRTCWERAGGDQKPATSVTVNATVGPDGRVQSASSSGDDPVVAKCIENQVKSWQFPASGSTTPIQIPFKFVRQ